MRAESRVRRFYFLITLDSIVLCRSKWPKNNIASHGFPRAHGPHITHAQPTQPHRTSHVYHARSMVSRTSVYKQEVEKVDNWSSFDTSTAMV